MVIKIHFATFVTDFYSDLCPQHQTITKGPPNYALVWRPRHLSLLRTMPFHELFGWCRGTGPSRAARALFN